MKITEVKYSRKYNLGNYESEEYTVGAIVDEDETAKDVFDQLKTEVSISAKPEEGEERELATDNTGSESEEEHDGDADADTEEDSDGKDSGDDAGEEESDDDSTEADGDAEEEEKQSKKGKGKPAPKADGKGKKDGKSYKKKPEVYSRTNEAHKDIFSNILSEVAPKWKTSDKSKKKAKEVSQEMEGVDFLDADGEVVKSFKQSVKKQMNEK